MPIVQLFTTPLSHRQSVTRCIRTLVAAALVLVATGVADGQDPSQAQDPPPVQDQTDIYGPPAPPAEPDPITTEQVQALLDGLNAIAEPDQPTRDAKDLYNQALATLRLYAQQRERTAEFERQRAAAAGTREQVQVELDNPPKPVEPTPPDDATIDQLRQFRDAAIAAHQTAIDQVANLREEATNRQQRRVAIPTERERLFVQLEDVDDELNAPPAGGESAVLTEARRFARLAKRQHIKSQLAGLEAELANYDARRDLLPKRTQRWEVRQNVRLQEANAWRAFVTQAEQDQARTEIAEARQELDSPYAVIRAIAQKNLELTQKRTAEDGPLLRKDQLQRELSQHGAQEISTLNEQFILAQDRADALAGSQTYDVILRRLRDDLPELNELNSRLRELDNEYADVQVDQSDYEYERERLGTPRQQIDKAIAAVTETVDEVTLDRIRADIERLVNEQRVKYDTLIADYRALSANLFELQEHYRTKIAVVSAFRRFIDERILWIRSADAITFADFSTAGERVLALIQPLAWAGVGRDFIDGVLRRPLLGVLIVVVFASGIFLVRRLTKIIRRAADQVERPFADRMRWTWQALAATAVLTLIWPTVLWLAAGAIYSSPEAREFSLSVAVGLSGAALVLLITDALRQICRPRGLADVHFGWRDRSRIVLKRTMSWLLPFAIPLAFLLSMLEWQTGNSGSDSLSRFLFIGGMIILAIAAARIMNPTTGIVHGYLEGHPNGWLDRLRYVWFGGLVAIPIALAIAAGFGYFYTAIQFEQRIVLTVWIITALIIVSGLARRWLLQARRRIAMEEARKRHAAAMAKLAESKKDGDVKPAETIAAIEEPKVNINEIDTQARQLLRTVMTIALVIGLWLVWAQMLPALRSLDRIELWPDLGIRDQVSARIEFASPDAARTTTAVSPPAQPAPAQPNGQAEPANGNPSNPSSGASPLNALTGQTAGSGNVAQTLADPIDNALSLGDLILSVIIICITVLLSRNLPGLLEMTLLQRLPLEPSGRYAVTTLARYFLIIVGTIMAFSAIGIGWSNVQWLAAAITVGLGFGLQEIFANFVSGIIILFERPIRVSDTVTIGNVHGTVTRIRMRATTVCDWDRKELIIPNKEFVTGQIINWSLTDSLVRVIIPVGIAYGSDTDLAKKLLLEVAKKNKTILDEPAPRAMFLGFGDSSLNLELRVFVPHIDYFMLIKDEMHTGIDHAFRANNIEIAFPQRDIHVRSIDARFPVDMKSADNTPEQVSTKPGK